VPYLQSEPPWFAFIAHPRDTRDLDSLPGASLLRTHCLTEQEFVARSCSLPPLVVGEILFAGSAVRGELIGVVRMPETLLGVQGRELVADAVQLAVDRGARTIGLGALTAPAMRGGRLVEALLPPGVVVTNGNALTANATVRNVGEAAEALGLGKDACVAVVGCTGSVGGVAARLLAEKGYELLLIGRRRERVKQEIGDLASNAIVGDGVGDAAHADVVVLVTSHPGALLEPTDVRPGAVVIDVAQPPNVARTALAAFVERGVRVVSGGLVRIPGYACTYPLHLPDRRDTFACLAETYVMAREGLREHSVGRPSMEFVSRIDRLARSHGIEPRPLSLERPPVRVASAALA
jgi:predicted amino acid dehydrogenase